MVITINEKKSPAAFDCPRLLQNSILLSQTIGCISTNFVGFSQLNLDKIFSSLEFRFEVIDN